VQDVALDLLSLTATVRGVSVAERGQTLLEAPIYVTQASAKVRLWPLMRRQVVLDEAVVSGVNVRLEVDRQNRVNLEELFRLVKDDPAKPSPWNVIIRQFTVDQATVHLTFDGQPLNTDRLSGDPERLQGQYRRAGYLTVRLEGPHIQRDLQRHTAVVSVAITEGSKINLEFTGNRKLSREVLEQAVLIDALGGYTEDTLLESEREMLQRYHEQGFPFATIDHQVEVEAGGRTVLITFGIDEGPQVTVKGLQIIGNSVIPAADIRGQFLTQPREFFGVLSKGLFIEKQLDKDLEAVQFLYR
jgi:outer membrane protein assembly factor BamA